MALAAHWYSADSDGTPRKPPVDPTNLSGIGSVQAYVKYFCGVSGYTGGAVVWTWEWTPVGTPLNVPVFLAPDEYSPGFPDPSGASIKIQLNGNGWSGTGKLTVKVDGIPVPNTLFITFVAYASGYPPYGSIAWDTEVPPPPPAPFWTGFVNTREYS